MSQSKNKNTWSGSGWLLDFIVPLLVLCLAVGWLIWWMWPKQQQVANEQFQVSSSVPNLTGTLYNGPTTPIYDNKSWTTDSNSASDNLISYCQIIAELFENKTKVLVNSLFSITNTSGAIPKAGLPYADLTPNLIEQMIITQKAKAKHISNLIGYFNADTSNKGFYILTDNGSDADYFIPGDIYAPREQQTISMRPLGFEYYLVFHKSVIDISNKPVQSSVWDDVGKGGSLDNKIVSYDNKLLAGYVYNDSIFKTVDTYYEYFGYVSELGAFNLFNSQEKPTITASDGNRVAIVTLNGNTYNFKYFDRDTYAIHGRPNNIKSITEITKMITTLLPTGARGETLDEKKTYDDFIQKANVICTSPGVSSPANQSLSEAVSYYWVRNIQLGDTYFVKQICIANLFTFADSSFATVSELRIGIKNSRTNTIQFVGFSERLLGADGTNYLEAITKRSGPYLVIQDVKTAYGNEISGDEVIIYSKIETGKAIPALDVCITGYPENETLDYKTLFTDATAIAGLPPVMAAGASVYPDVLYTDGEVSQTTQADVPSHITTVELASYDVSKPLYNTLLYKQSVIYIANDSSGKSLKSPKNGAKLTVLFKNNYSNNTFQVPGPVNHEFIYHERAPKLFFYKTVIANKFKIYFDKAGVDANTWHASAVSAKGYTPTGADINRFKLEFNVTDIRGSINPEAVCPSMDKFLSNQLDSEVILDAMSYNDKINTEQAKLMGQKDNLLTLMEQEEDITRLNRVINRLLDIEKQRSNETNTLNAVKFTNQMKEAIKLKEVLEDRIAQRKKNTLDLQFRVNQVVETDQLPTATLASSKEPFEDIPVPTNATNRVPGDKLEPALEDYLRIR